MQIIAHTYVSNRNMYKYKSILLRMVAYILRLSKGDMHITAEQGLPGIVAGLPNYEVP